MSLSAHLGRALATPGAVLPTSLLLEQGLEHLDAGVTIFDTDLRLVFSNGKFLELRGLPEHLGRPGTAFADIVRHNAEQGIYGPGECAGLLFPVRRCRRKNWSISSLPVR